MATGRMTHRRATIGSAVVLALYEYDARDRLITETGTIDPMARLWLRPDGTYCVAPGPRPSPLPGRGWSALKAVIVVSGQKPVDWATFREPEQTYRLHVET